ncbi:beta-lactamase/transpeptidase-like protein [Truncatella angustata]|uniref:Beta-lactamase/transpeptidase-like protein n=1 Tax=Truncatella angustata TaxID=152316 RepID=A0A9P8RHE7_9PEZI|nr:beta-lactamase/transpeptidase-like protein [Truncatella angustata]KAH6646068.1 beta-lactamase/transpeptidase-like protein [Truncatella angustata]
MKHLAIILVMSTFDNLLSAAVADHVIPGAAMVARNKSGTLKFNKSFGLQSSGTNSDIPYSASTVLEMASMTKLITSIAALQLIERGLVGLDDDLSSILPELASQPILTGFDPAGKPQLKQRRNPITLRLLLTHSTGAGYTFTPGSVLAEYRTRIQGGGILDGATVNARFDFPLLYEPGEDWEYGHSIDRAGQVVERVSGLRLGTYFRENIFAPLGIRSGTFTPELDTDPGSRAAVTFRDPETGRAVERPGEPTLAGNTTEDFGGQGLHMSVEDYLKVLESLLLDDGKLLDPKVAKTLFEPQLGPKSKEALLKAVVTREDFVGNFPKTGEYDWSFGGAVIDGDSHEFRKKGALLWGGAANLFFFVDREAGVTGVFGTQVYPSGDKKIKKLYSAFEKEIYKLGASQ